MTDGLGRRRFLQSGLGASALLATSGEGGATSPESSKRVAPKELSADVAILGGGLGGCSATLAALREGATVILAEESDWLGGQMTSQAVPSDEHPWIEMVGNPSFLEFRNHIRDYYRRNYRLNESAKNQKLLNPGYGSVSPVCCEPRVALAALEELLAPFASLGTLTLLLNHKPIRAEVTGDTIEAVVLEDCESGGEKVVSAPTFIDATELGNILELARVEHVTGAESQKDTGEPHAPTEADPTNMQAVTWCFPMEYRPGENHVGDKPDRYDYWRNYVPDLTPPWTGPQLSRKDIHPHTLESRLRPFDPEREGQNKTHGFWRYRRIRYAGHFLPAFRGYDVSLVNWPMNDYWGGNVFGGTDEENNTHLAAAKSLSRSLFYWLQTECPHDDGGGAGWPGLRLRPDLVGTEDGLAKRPYVRESRRIKALFTVLEQHVGTDARMEQTGASREEVAAEPFRDSVGIGSYRIDLHPSTGGDNYIDISSLPFQIPLGALIPVRVKNLLAANKNIGTTHITNGCYRLHPVEWNIGEAAGMLAAWAKKTKRAFHQVHENDKILGEFQGLLRKRGIKTSWPRFTPR